MQPGNVVLVLHAHAPYVRQASRSANGEEPLHQLVIETYVPLLSGLYELVKLGYEVQLGLALSPILLEQLADRVVQKHITSTLEMLIEEAEQTLRQQTDDHGAYLAQFYAQVYQRTYHIFERQWQRDLVAATRALVDQGVIEPLMHTATHIVPHLHDQTALRTQLQVGQLALSRHLGRQPHVMWAANDALHPALMTLLPPLAVRGIIGNPHQELFAAEPAWIDPDRTMWVLPPHERLITHMRSQTLGYPSDGLYRSAVADQALSGARYDPYHAFARARLHAKHFVAVLEQYRRQFPLDQPRILSLALDMEVFGSGWFEGGMWLRSLIREIDRSPFLVLRGPAAAMAEHPIQRRSNLVVGQPEPIDGALNSAALRLQQAIQRNYRPDANHERVLNQAARELLLAQSGDWDRWKATAAAAYAQARRTTHLAHVHDLLRLSAHEQLSPSQLEFLTALEEQDNPFPFAHFRLFAHHEDDT